MYHSHRLVALGYPGKVHPDPFSYLLSSGALFKQASKAGLVVGLRRLSDDPRNLESTAPLILDFTPSFDSTLSSAGSWDADAPGAAKPDAITESLPNAFKGGVGIAAGLGWTVTDPDITGSLANAQTITKNRAHSIRFFLEKPASTTGNSDLASSALWQYRFDAWQFQARDGKFQIMRRLPAWSQSQEDTLHNLEKLKAPSEAQTTQIETLRTTIYADFQDSLSLGEVYNRVVCLTFIAEPGPGNLHIFSHSGEYAKVEHSEIRDKRLTSTEGVGAMWNTCTRSHRSRGHLWFGQWGYPVFKTTATLKTPLQKNGRFTDSMEAARTTGVWDTSATGSNVSLAYEATDEIHFRFTLTLSGDGTGTPFVYSALAVLDPGERTGSDEVFWDSDDHRRESGNTIIKTVSPQFDGPRRLYHVEVWDMGGTAFPPALSGSNHHCLEGRLVNLYTNGEADVIHGLIVDATPSPLASVEEGITRAEASKENSLITLTIADGHYLLDEAEVKADAIGDTLDGNEWLRFWLRCAGFRASELTRIPTTFQSNLGFGEKLPPIEGAAWGENPRERPAKGAKIGAYLNDFTLDYGMGALLLHTPNGWEFERMPSELRVWNSHQVAFWGKGGGHNRGNPATYPGRFAVLDVLEAPRDWTDAFNEFPVEGAEKPDGTRVSASYVIYESQNPEKWDEVANHMGRVRVAPTYQNDSLRTEDQCWRAARGRAARSGAAPGRYYVFNTYYHPFLRPFDVIQVFGRWCRIDRIPMADSYADRMQIAARQM